jgi:NADH:ubiquinone oxidoreductase subunit 2 (subunit N)
MAGIPPLGGFFAKYYLFQAAMPAAAYGLIIVGLATSLLSSYYYLRLIKVFWFEEKTLMKRKKVTVYLNRTHRSILTTLEALL